ncbi:hypothetical protein GQ43DRAFT_466119 [Delitschia confertaspora ATCC 74209]|uniref:Uncharacterized protein n=1 Tax=Delitschia confertaspora ATCC 74209 TaxID=1513339 RepID=A0A9P4MP33_9PLEO|nr:hypothetical protein GQ43DRAFT_466119 [Delitschia confertaspora ATCC 74209]
MFRPFSFEPASQGPSLVDLHDEHASMNVSPTQTRFTTPPICSLRELALEFDGSNFGLKAKDESDGPKAPLTPQSEDLGFNLDFIEPYEPPSPSSIASMDLRDKRQANSRLQCSTTHVRDISLLVERMVEKGDQCSVCPRKRPSAIDVVEEEDEGLGMEYTPPTLDSPPSLPLKFRRSGDRVDGHACVSKNVRMRKKHGKFTKKTSSR